MAPQDITDHLTTVFERTLTTTVDNIEHIESESLYGMAVVKIFCSQTPACRGQSHRLPPSLKRI
jgi:hypothetical protein